MLDTFIRCVLNPRCLSYPASYDVLSGFYLTLSVAEDFGFPLMVKSRKLAYDGKGNAVGPDRYCSSCHRMTCN